MCAWIWRGHKDRQVRTVPAAIILYDHKYSPCGQQCHLPILTYLLTSVYWNVHHLDS